MNPITDDNFKQLYGKIETSLKNCSFIAIDAEFSGLTRANGEYGVRLSLFDSAQDRYAKLKEDIQPFVAIQLGVTTFTHAKDDNRYNSECFHFHLLPRAFPSENRVFLFQAQAIEFLSTHNFDFNQLAYNGISYLTEADELKLRQSLDGEGPPWWCTDEFSTSGGQNEVDKGVEQVQNWLANSNHPDKELLMSASNFPVQYVMQKQLRRAINGIWTAPRGMRTFSVIKVTSDVRKKLEQEEEIKRILDGDLLDYYMGFSKIVKLMKSLRKPIVGHNILLDLMFIYKQFFRPLPKRYEDFKSNVNQIFPFVYDTKFLSYELKNVLQMKCWNCNGLAELYSYFKDEAGRHLAFNSPKIASLGTDIISGDGKFHDAGWDSYCTGYCFIRMAHIYTVKKLSNRADMRVFTNVEIMSGVREQINRINLIRASISHLRLDNSDPPSTRPRWFRVRTRASNTTTRQIAQAFSQFGAVDVKRQSVKCFLVAVPNHGTAQVILKHYEKNSEFQVAPYDSFSHVLGKVNVLIWTGSLVLSGAGVIVWLLSRNSQPSEFLR